jgi:hypothetical protein
LVRTRTEPAEPGSVGSGSRFCPLPPRWQVLVRSSEKCLREPDRTELRHPYIQSKVSDVLAGLGPKAPALAWPEAALACSRLGPSQSRHSRLGLGLARPRPRLLACGVVLDSARLGM